MKRCIKLAKKGEGKTAPNPMVGAVIFDDNFDIIAEGYHEKYGEKHAEVNAIESRKISYQGLSIAVNLEPCSHHGKNPPCADRIIKEGFKRVIVGVADPNPLVGGNGIKKLKEAGIEVISGILEEECRQLNEIFIKNHVEKKAFIAIKTATTLDGKIACENGNSKWITSEKARNYVQKLRNHYDAILAGSGTVIKDNPKLNFRKKSGKNPIRIIVDSKLITPTNSNVYNDDKTRVIIATSTNISEEKQKTYPKNVEFLKCNLINNHIDLEELTKKLYHMEIRSILVESGPKLNAALIDKKLIDKLIQFIAPKILGDKKAINFVEGFFLKNINNSIILEKIKTKKLYPDVLIEAYFKK